MVVVFLFDQLLTGMCDNQFKHFIMKKWIAISILLIVSVVCYSQEDLGAKYTDNPSAALSDARSSFNSGDYERAVRLVKIYQVLSGDRNGSDILTKAQQCQQYVENAVHLEEQGDVPGAIRCYQSILGINPNDKSTKRAIDAAAAKKGYMDISRISFANVQSGGEIITDYGGTLYKEEMRYLKPRVYYNGLASENKTLELYFKIFRPDGTLDIGNSSPSGYTRKETITVYPGSSNTFVTSGWGNKDGGSYSAGTYRFEVWFNGNKLYSTSFDIKSKPQTYTSSSGSQTHSSSRSSSRRSSSGSDFFLSRKPEENYPDMGFIFGLGNLTTVGAEFNGNIKSVFFGLDAAVNLGKYDSAALGDEIMGGAFITGSLGYRTQYWGAAFCGGNQWVSSMVDGKETTQSVGFVYGPKLAIYPIPQSSRVGIAIYLSYLMVPGLPELNGFKFGIGFRM